MPKGPGVTKASKSRLGKLKDNIKPVLGEAAKVAVEITAGQVGIPADFTDAMSLVWSPAEETKEFHKEHHHEEKHNKKGSALDAVYSSYQTIGSSQSAINRMQRSAQGLHKELIGKMCEMNPEFKTYADGLIARPGDFKAKQSEFNSTLAVIAHAEPGLDGSDLKYREYAQAALALSDAYQPPDKKHGDLSRLSQETYQEHSDIYFRGDLKSPGKTAASLSSHFAASALTGAMHGAAAGPVGAVVGGAIGPIVSIAHKEYVERANKKSVALATQNANEASSLANDYARNFRKATHQGEKNLPVENLHKMINSDGLRSGLGLNESIGLNERKKAVTSFSDLPPPLQRTALGVTNIFTEGANHKAQYEAVQNQSVQLAFDMFMSKGNNSRNTNLYRQASPQVQTEATMHLANAVVTHVSGVPDQDLKRFVSQQAPDVLQNIQGRIKNLGTQHPNDNRFAVANNFLEQNIQVKLEVKPAAAQPSAQQAQPTVAAQPQVKLAKEVVDPSKPQVAKNVPQVAKLADGSRRTNGFINARRSSGSEVESARIEAKTVAAAVESHKEKSIKKDEPKVESEHSSHMRPQGGK